MLVQLSISILLIMSQFILPTHANTETISISIPHTFKPDPDLVSVDNTHDPIHIAMIDDLTKIHQISPEVKRTLAIDFLSVAERRSIAVKNGRNINPVSVMLEIVNFEVHSSYNFKVCWSAMSPVEIELAELVIPGGDNDNQEELHQKAHDRIYLKITLKPNYYSNTPVNLEKYLNNIIIDIECINSNLIRNLVGWVVACLAVGIALSRFMTGFIEERAG